MSETDNTENQQHTEEKTVVVNKIGGNVEEEQSGGFNESSPISTESKNKLDAMELMDETEFGLAPNPEQQTGGNDEEDHTLQKGGADKPKLEDKAVNKGEETKKGGSMLPEDTEVVGNDGHPDVPVSKRANNKTKKSSIRASHGSKRHRMPPVDVVLPMGGKAVIPFKKPTNINLNDVEKKFKQKYELMKSMKDEDRRRKIAELEAVVFEHPVATDLANGLLDIIDDRALKCMVMKAVLVDGL